MKIRVVRKKVQWIEIEVEAESLEEAKEKADDGKYDDDFAFQEFKGNYSADYSFGVARKYPKI